MKKKHSIFQVISLCIILVATIVLLTKYVKEKNKKELINKYCTFSVQVTDTHSLADCFQKIIELEAIDSKLAKEMNKDFPSLIYSDENDKITDFLRDERNKNYRNVIKEYLQLCSEPTTFPASEIADEIVEKDVWLSGIAEYCQDEMYGDAFSFYQLHNPVHSENCFYYIINTTFPEVFSIGIRERLLHVGIRRTGEEGQELLEDMLLYIDSLPNGRNGYETDIALVQQKLSVQNAQIDSKENFATTRDVPYYGMSASLISITALGAPDSSEKCLDYYALRPERRSIEYTWYDEYGDLLFVALTQNGEVISVSDFR